MAAQGARGETAEQMNRILHLDAADDMFDSPYNPDANMGQTGLVKLYSANALFTRADSPINPDFLEVIRRKYAAAASPLDFATNPEGARLRINNWVSDKTLGKIRELVPSTPDLRNTEIMIVNALYFAAEWLGVFSEDDTRHLPFHISDRESIVAPMMCLSDAYFNHYQEPGVQVLDIPYKGNKYSMLVVLPDEVSGLADIEKSLTATRLAGWVANLERRKVTLGLPKFTLRLNMELSKCLKQLGMTLPFTSSADFSGITCTNSLVLSSIFHTVFIEVNERGTEAAAATALGFFLCAAKPTFFIADHPFLFLIHERATGNILFMGRVTQPYAPRSGGLERAMFEGANGNQTEQTVAPNPKTEFAINLYRALINDNENLVFSPASIWTALAMAGQGARGETAEQMNRILHLDPTDDMSDSPDNPVAEMSQAGVKVTSVNALFTPRDYPICGDFLGIARHGYRATASPIDFATNPERALLIINNWVSEKTNHKIRELIPPIAIHRETKIIIADAVHFVAEWAKMLPATDFEAFRVSDGESASAPMIHASRVFRCHEEPDVQILDIPHKDNNLSTLLILPREVSGLAEIENSLTAARLAEWIIMLEARQVTLSVPSFTILSNMELSKGLMKLGMTAPFDSSADFSGIASKGLSISKFFDALCVHICVGNEFSHLIAAEFRPSFHFPEEMEPVVFNADHPFLFLIHERATGNILFMGRVIEP
jgi:serpin B